MTELQIITNTFSALDDVDHSFMPLNCRLHIVTVFQGIQYKEGENNNFAVEKPTNTTLAM